MPSVSAHPISQMTLKQSPPIALQLENGIPTELSSDTEKDNPSIKLESLDTMISILLWLQLHFNPKKSMDNARSKPWSCKMRLDVV